MLDTALRQENFFVARQANRQDLREIAMWKDHLGMFSTSRAITRFGFVTAFCSLAACQMDDSASSVQQSSDQLTVLSGFDVANFTPGVDCRDDLPFGRTVSMLNGYRTRLVGKVETRKKYGFDYYLYAIESSKLNCPFYFANVGEGSKPVAANAIRAKAFYSKRWFLKIKELLPTDQYQCLSSAFMRPKPLEYSKDNEQEDKCISVAAKKIGSVGVQGVAYDFTERGNGQEYMIIDGNVFFGGKS